MNTILNTTFLLVMRVGLTIFLLVYLFFAVIVIRQIKTMTDTLEVGLEVPIKILGIAHFLGALLILILSFLIL